MATDSTNSAVRPAARIQTASFRASRPMITGPPSPAVPYPITLEGVVSRGFGRGGKDLGCPTANFPEDNADVEKMVGKVDTGVYYGWAKVEASDLSEKDNQVHPMVMSLGWNPFYKNTKLTAEIHIMHEFSGDFYERPMRVMVLGYIRPELDYLSRDALIEDINTDILVARNCLAREMYVKYSKDPFFHASTEDSKL